MADVNEELLCMSKRPRVLIVGGGIAGLSTALALKKNGHNPIVLESRAVLTEYGAGINVQPGAVDALTKSCGIPQSEIIEGGFVVSTSSYYTADGRLVAKVPKGSIGTPQVSIHRATLLRMLKEHAYAAKIPIKTSHRVMEYERTDTGVKVGTEAGDVVQGECVLACDGVHSRMGRITGKTGPIIYSKTIMFRGVADDQDPFLDGKTMILLGSMTKKCGRLVCYPIANQPNGKQQINWVLEVPADISDENRTADYDSMVTAAQVLELVNDLSADFLDIKALIKASEPNRIGCWPMIDKDPYPSLCDDKMAVVGDAAHPMYPVGSNGATSAILDGKAIGDSFGIATAKGLDAAGIAAGIAGYEKARKGIVQAAQLSCRDMAADKIVDDAMDNCPTGEIPAEYAEKIKDCLVKMQGRARTTKNLLQKDDSARLLIVGGGIAGLSTALALKKNGHNPIVLESRAVLTEYGAGINVQPGAVDALTKSCGIPQAEILEGGFVVSSSSYYTADGRLVAKVPKGSIGTPQVSIHRATLLRMLKEHAYKAGIPIKTSHRVVDYERTATGVVVTTMAGDIVQGECVLACDGVHSRMGKVTGKTGPIVYSTTIMFRGVADDQDPFLDGKTMILLGSMTKKCGRLVCYPIASQPNGKQQINWVLEVPANISDSNRTADYDSVVTADQVLALVNDLSADFLDIKALIKASEPNRIGCWPMIDKDPYPSLCDDKMAVVGDAAHPMYPVGSNGATSAILDGQAIGDSFGEATPAPLSAEDIAEAIQGYEDKRKSVVQAAQLSCRDMQADKVVDDAMDNCLTGAIPAEYAERIKDCLVKMQGRQRTTKNLLAGLSINGD